MVVGPLRGFAAGRVPRAAEPCQRGLVAIHCPNGGRAMTIRGPCRFTQRDVTRAVRAVVAAGVQVAKVEVDKAGKIVVFVAGNEQESADEGREANNEWDRI
jgi:hypothetical protein